MCSKSVTELPKLYASTAYGAGVRLKTDHMSLISIIHLWISKMRFVTVAIMSYGGLSRNKHLNI